MRWRPRPAKSFGASKAIGSRGPQLIKDIFRIPEDTEVALVTIGDATQSEKAEQEYHANEVYLLDIVDVASCALTYYV